MVQKTVRDVVTKIGLREVGRLAQVSDQMVRHAARNGKFPAEWYDVIDQGHQKAGGGPVPRDLFKFKTPPDAQTKT